MTIDGNILDDFEAIIDGKVGNSRPETSKTTGIVSRIDADGSVSIAGGTLIVLGYGRVSASGDVQTYSLDLHTQGEHTVRINGTSYTFTNAYAYRVTAIYSDVAVAS